MGDAGAGCAENTGQSQGCDFCKQIGPMEIIFVLAALLLSSIAILILLLLAAGLACIFGASFAPVFRRGLWLLLLPPLCILYGWLAGRERFVVKEAEIVSPVLPEAFDGYRIVQISDLHLRSFSGRQKSLERVVDKINAQRPDIVVFTGELGSLQIGKDTVKEVIAGKECGMSIAGYNDIKEGDIIEAFQIVEIKRTL